MMEESQVRKRVLIISTYKIDCGIASFTEALETQIPSDEFEIEIFPLDQFILRGTHEKLIRTGNRIIEDLCQRLPSYDVVNLQWEPGTLGARQVLIAARFRKILSSSRNIVLTMHTVTPDEVFRVGEFLRRTLSLNPMSGIRYLNRSIVNDFHSYNSIIYSASKRKNVAVIVHTKRERRFFTQVVEVDDVHDHPLSLMHSDWPGKLDGRAAEFRKDMDMLFGDRKVIVGVFGFISPYKGLETAIRAVKALPDEYACVISGFTHPNSIEKHVPINSYLEIVINMIEHDFPGEVVNATLSNLLSMKNASIKDYIDLLRGGMKEFLAQERRDRKRFLFQPALDDFDFAATMKACDICVFPYLETGQSASGPISLAIEQGKKVIATRNGPFMQLAKYFPGRIRFIDIGNHLHLSQEILRLTPLPEPGTDDLPYNFRTQGAFYASIFRDLASKG